MAPSIQSNGYAVEAVQLAGGQLLELIVLGINSGTSMVSTLWEDETQDD
jgi:hypothetical protein